jgi:hypothetical protein
MVGLSFASAPTMVCPTGYTTGDFSISYWVYFINKANSGGTSTYQYIVTGGRLQVHQYFGNANIAYNSGGTVAFSQTGGVWTHLTYVYTTSGTTNITVFQNGIQVATANTGINAAGNFTFGQGSGLTFISYLADIRIVPFRLTANQALLLYQSYVNGSWASTGNVGILRLSNQFAAGQTITAFAATGAVQTFVVPGGVSSIRFFMWGAGGNNQNQNGTIVNSVGGGSGAYLDGTIFVSPGTTLYIIVGVNGGTTLAQGGAGASTFSGSGGGFSGIFTGSPASGNVIAIAGGGGGSGVNGGGNGGGGGYPSGGSGTGNSPGSGGSQSAGGSLNGTQLQGGATGAQGGGGGGGWYGGGAAVNQNNGGGGGGGSSTYTAAVISPISINGNTGISTNGSNTPAPNEASPYWSSPAGRSAASGRVVFVYSAAPARIFFSSPTPTTTVTFGYTGANQTFVAPPGKLYAYVYMWGAGGSGINGNGGLTTGGAGAMVQGVLRLQGGQSYTILVGGGGTVSFGSTFGGGGAGAPFGGGTSGQGGGRSAIQLNSVDLVTAGGGGGGGYAFSPGGSATFSGTANAGADGTGGTGGGGGTQTSGGAGGTPYTGGTGTLGQGGAGGGNWAYGGGGGGGYYGGGGGSGSTSGSQRGGGGGGGSSYTANLQLIPGQSVLGFNSSDGNAAPNTSSPYYSGVIGRGGTTASTNGGNGLVVIVY